MRFKRRNGAIRRITLKARKVVEVRDDFNRILSTNTTTFNAELCTVQPFVGDTFLLSPEGLQNKDVYTLFTSTPLQVGKQGTANKADEVFYDNKWFRVVKVKNWAVGLIPHYECIIVELDGGLK